MKRRLQQALHITALCSLLFAARTAQAQGNPVTITSGFNQDIIANGVGNASASSTMGFDQQNTRALLSLDFQATSSSSLPGYGLPTNGTITSAATSGVTFQLAGYTGNNALFLTPSYVGNGAPSTGTLAFSTSNVSTLYILAGATGGGLQVIGFDATINFSDNTTQTNTNVLVNDWYNGTGYAIQGIGRVNTTNNTVEGTSTNPRLYEIPIALNAGNQNKTITGITFSFAGAPAAEWANEIRLNVLAVSAQAAPASVNVTTQGSVPASITTDGGTLQLAATVSPASAGAVTWSIASGSQYATVSASGLVTATANGIVTVRATLNSDTTIYDEIAVNITNQVTAVTGVTVTTEGNVPATITTNGGTLQLLASVAPANATNDDVTWAITAGSAYASLSSDGLVTATANGTVTVTVTTVDGSFTDTIDIVITGQAVAVTGISISVANDAPATITTEGGTLQLEAAIAPSDATNTDVTWTVTSGSDYAAVSAGGLVTASANGTVTVTATTTDGSFTDTIDVVITGQYVAVTSITVTVENNAEPQITTVGGTLQLVANVVPADADTEVTWSIVSGGEYASISAEGLVTAIANGTVVLRATEADGSVYGEITITINIPTNGLNNVTQVVVGAYPNPTSNIITVTASQEISSITVCDIFGKEVLRFVTSQVDLSAMSTGVYFINVTLGSTSQTIKVIKQ
jgi:uncharacterized protein YjdB